MKTYTVKGRPLTVNDETIAKGESVKFHPADGQALVDAGRLEDPAKASAPDKK